MCKRAQVCLRMLSTKCVYKSYIFNIYKKDLALSNLQWLIFHKTKPDQISLNIRKLKESCAVGGVKKKLSAFCTHFLRIIMYFKNYYYKCSLQYYYLHKCPWFMSIVRAANDIFNRKKCVKY